MQKRIVLFYTQKPRLGGSPGSITSIITGRNAAKNQALTDRRHSEMQTGKTDSAFADLDEVTTINPESRRVIENNDNNDIINEESIGIIFSRSVQGVKKMLKGLI